jgi:hypothetical protein
LLLLLILLVLLQGRQLNLLVKAEEELRLAWECHLWGRSRCG